MADVAALNKRFGVSGRIVFKDLAANFPAVEVETPAARAIIALQGAQVLTWAPRGEEPVIWLSRAAKFAPGKSVRGGVPVCWPWFGAHATEPGFPAHGFARTVPWEVVDVTTVADDAPRFRFRLQPSDATRAQWPHATDLTLSVTVGAALDIELITRNTGSQPVTVTEALHTYFAVGDVRRTSVHGLDGLTYLDKVENFKRKQQSGPVAIAGEVDRIYLGSVGDCVIDDVAQQRCIRIAKSGSASTVVWNPGAEKAEKMGDLGDDGYLHMVCVESANAADDAVLVSPASEHRFTVRYTVERPP